MKFRELKAEEIEVRVGSVKSSGAVLLLYKDARADMNILDEVAGAENWKREHQVINNNLFCTVSIYNKDTKEWISKQDVGTESFTEKEKGQASDSFKRACVNWGIGRELYTAPFIFVTVETEQQGKVYKLKDKYCLNDMKVSKFKCEDGKIIELEIKDKKGKVIYPEKKSYTPETKEPKLNAEKKKEKETQDISEMPIDTKQVQELLDLVGKDKDDIEAFVLLIGNYNYDRSNHIKCKDFAEIKAKLIDVLNKRRAG